MSEEIMQGSSKLLQKLRQMMSRKVFDGRQLDAYLVFTADAHQSEYPMESDKRREFLTGFTGSAGTAVVTHDEALLWTDGRYFLQAKEELSSDWTLQKAGLPNTPKIEEWLSKNLSKGSMIGLCNRFVSLDFYKRLKQNLSSSDMMIFSVDNDLVDLIWEESGKRPKDSTKSIFWFDTFYTGEEFPMKIKRMQDKIRENADALLSYALDEICWLFNIRGYDGLHSPVFKAYAVVMLDSAHLFMDRSKIPASDGESYFKQYPSLHIHDYSQIEKFLEELGAQGKKVWCDRSVPANLVCKFAPNKVHLEVTPICKAKAIKSESEIRSIKDACVKDCTAICELYSILEKDFKQYDEMSVCDKLLEIRKQIKGFIFESFPTIAGSGPNGAVIHYRPTVDSSRKLSEKEMFLCDCGSQFFDGTTDITRTMHFGSPTSEEIHMYTLVLKGHVALARCVFPEGIKGHNVDTFARQYLWSEGYDFLHGTGHGVGMFLNVHEGPVSISRTEGTESVPIAHGMLLTNEPGYYEDGKFGIRLENMMIAQSAVHPVSKKNVLTFKTVSLVPFHKPLIDLSMLNADEIQWIDSYHRECYETLQPVLERNNKHSTIEWLKKHTQPLRSTVP